MFQSTHPHGVRLNKIGNSILIIKSFNPRTRTGCDLKRFPFASAIIVSIHAPARGATANREILNSDNLFQSTHPHGVRLCRHPRYVFNGSVSIHAPARGATRAGRSAVLLTYVSIHAPARGATLPLYFLSVLFMFQSTHPHGVRQSTFANSLRASKVSIHAPARGATYAKRRLFRNLRFQSTHPHGVRLRRTERSKSEIRFQSTHPHGVRRTGGL